MERDKLCTLITITPGYGENAYHWLGLCVLCSLRNSIGTIFREAVHLRSEVVGSLGNRSGDLHSSCLHAVLRLILSLLISFLLKMGSGDDCERQEEMPQQVLECSIESAEF